MTTLTLAACMGNIGPVPNGAPGGASPAGTGGTPNPGSGGSALTGGAGSSLPAGTAGVSGTAGNGAGGTGGIPVVLDCSATAPGRSPMRRLTTYEYNNTIRDLLGDTTNPGSALPAQVDSKQNLFGNDADQQSPSALLIEKYQSVAESVAARATASTTALAKLHSCAQQRDHIERGVVRADDCDVARAAGVSADGRDVQDSTNWSRSTATSARCRRR